MNELIYCKCCKRHLNKRYVYKKSIKQDNTAYHCKSCDYFKRNDRIELLDSWTFNDYFKIVDFILNNHDKKYLNELQHLIIGRELKEILSVVADLNIHNKFLRVQIYCGCCRKEVNIKVSDYLKTKTPYCSYECYWADKTNRVDRGRDNVSYNRISTSCTNCNKEINVIPFDYNKKNKHGDNHNFCSQDCYWKYRSKYYVKEKSSIHNYIPTEEQKEKRKLTILNNGRASKRLDTKIQLIVNNILEEINVLYEREHIIKYYAIDNYLINSGLMIEVMGDYWHSNPMRYNMNRLLNTYQFKWLWKDKAKLTYIKSKTGINILYLWESDILKRQDLCKKLILLYLNKNGNLSNYHSFNYCLDSRNKIKLSDNFITPYQDMPVDEYRHLVKA